MIHFISWLPHPYQQTLCRVLHESYGSDFVAWFAESSHKEFPHKSTVTNDFATRYLDKDGYGKLFKSLLADKEAVVILGGWRSPMSGRVLLITSLLRVPILIWSDHPHPRNRNLIVSTLRKAYLRFLSRMAVSFLGCGKPTVDHLVSLGIKRDKVTVFPYWTDVPDDWQPIGGMNNQEFVPLRLVAIGRMVEVKRFEVIIEALAIANQNERIAELVLAGDGPERKALEKLAKERCSEWVKFPGWLEIEAVAQTIRAADVMVVSSKFEGYSAVVLEAMAAGRPVLASEAVIAAIDRDEGTGAILLHPVGDAECLANQIKMLAHDRQRLHQASLAARATAEKWPPTRAVQILNEVLARTEPGRRLISHSYEYQSPQ